MVNSVAEDLLSDVMQETIMSDIILEIIKNNEVSKMVDSHIDVDRIANYFAENILR